jgi:hypothetical protein
MSSKELLNQLIKEGKLKKQTTDLEHLNGLLSAAKRNFDAAELLKKNVDEAAFKLIYDGLLQIGRVIVLLNGYRPDDGNQHKTTFLVAGEMLGEEYEELIGMIQRFRIKRNNCVYEPLDFLTRSETEAIDKIAREFWAKAKKYLEAKNPQLKLF